MVRGWRRGLRMRAALSADQQQSLPLPLLLSAARRWSIGLVLPCRKHGAETTRAPPKERTVPAARAADSVADRV